MKNSHKLFLVRFIYTFIYALMAAASVYILLAGLLGITSQLLWLSLLLISIEGIVFIGKGRQCPLTSLAGRYGAEKGYAFDLFLPEQVTKYTFRFFTSIVLIGVILLLLRHFIIL